MRAPAGAPEPSDGVEPGDARGHPAEAHAVRGRPGDGHPATARRTSVNDTLTGQIATFVQDVVNSMGVTLTATVEETPEATRINLEGEDGGVFIRRGGEGLQALQHIVATAFRKQLGDDNRIVIDCNGFRRDKDKELRQMALFMAGKAKMSGPQEMGPLNPYERRIVHMAIAEDPSVSSESIGDAFMKTVIISARSH
jgi:spoIIIJ-associated protein